MEFEKRTTTGVVFEGNTLKGLWFAKRSDAVDLEKIKWMLAMEDTKGEFKTSEEDYFAVTQGYCEVKPGPENLGGFFVFFPSAT